jgi:molybdate transport system ATP-binding protein
MLAAKLQKRRGEFRLEADFSVEAPGIIALFGRSGSGKSTLINLIAGLVQADTGTIALDGEMLLDTSRSILVPAEERGIGYVFQDAKLFPHLSVVGNLKYALHRARRSRFIHLDEVVTLLGLAALLDRRVHGLSGGERQRVAIGRALLSQPRLLLLDEPMASLDTQLRSELLPYLESLRDRLSIPMVYVSHDFDEVWRLASHLVLMEDGKTIAQGSMAEMSRHPKLRAIVGSEAVGAVVEGKVLGEDPINGLTRIAAGSGELHVSLKAPVNTALRLQVLARDVIVATEEPKHVSVRNRLAGRVVRLDADGEDAELIGIDIGGAEILARITRAASQELGLRVDLPVWALVKSVSLRGHLARVPK